MTDREPRCWQCHKKMAEELTRPWKIVCNRCHARNQSEPLDKNPESATVNAKTP